ncbi:MAG: YqgE/AlgH family protein [Spirochaetaceae bacterium]|nr:MAG: YqgE/AlgH family protein [Spirochaetaceae bacterium]
MRCKRGGKGIRNLQVYAIVSWLAAITLLMIWIVIDSGRAGIEQPNPEVGRSSVQIQQPAFQVQSLDRPQGGTFLVAARTLQDPNFAQTVVFLIDYDAQGAFGLIIDRPTRHTMAELWPEIAGLDAHSVYFGGPVFPNRLLFLLRSDGAPEGMRQVIPGVHLGSDELILKRIIASGEDEFRVYAGYSGWAPGQLDNEIARGDWHIIPAERRFIFDPRPAEVWKELIQRVDIQVVKLPQ